MKEFKYVEGANLFLDQMIEELGGRCDRDRAWRILRAVFHVMRDRLTEEESFHLISELPMLLKALYVDGWQPQGQRQKIRSVDSFVECVWQACGQTAQGDLLSRTNGEEVIRKTLKVINSHLSKGERDHVRASLPHSLRSLFEDGSAGGIVHGGESR